MFHENDYVIIDGCQYHPTDPELTILTMTEIKALYRQLERQYVSYEDIEAIQVVKKLRKIIENYELARRNNQSTQGT